MIKIKIENDSRALIEIKIGSKGMSKREIKGHAHEQRGLIDKMSSSGKKIVDLNSLFLVKFVIES